MSRRPDPQLGFVRQLSRQALMGVVYPAPNDAGRVEDGQANRGFAGYVRGPFVGEPRLRYRVYNDEGSRLRGNSAYPENFPKAVIIDDERDRKIVS
jgi:hypothetical protein